jgi:hypothetical protein
MSGCLFHGVMQRSRICENPRTISWRRQPKPAPQERRSRIIILKEMSSARERILKDSRVVKTARGTIDYSTAGKGLPVLFIL